MGKENPNGVGVSGGLGIDPPPTFEARAEPSRARAPVCSPCGLTRRRGRPIPRAQVQRARTSAAPARPKEQKGGG
jgi:hypothetical protein